MIVPTQYRKKLEGKSNAHLISFNDGRDYVVKFFQTGFERTLPNEWIGYCLARYLGLPTPFAQIVSIPQEFCSQIPELAEMNIVDYQFASLYVPDCFDGHQVVHVPKIINHQSLASIILFDYWLCNKDRTRKNIILCEETPNSYQLWAIDHAEILGSYDWQQIDLDILPIQLMKSATHQLMAKFIDNEQALTEQLDIIQKIPILLLEEIVALIPEEWMVTKEERKAIVTSLVNRRRRDLPKLMQTFIHKIYRPLHDSRE
jgi:hypothetical protein